MAVSFKSLVSSVLGPRKAPASSELFDKPDGDDCLQDCESCTVRYPRSFKIDEDDALYGHVKGWSTHVLVGTGKSDWVRDVADEKGSVMQAISKADAPANGVSFQGGTQGRMKVDEPERVKGTDSLTKTPETHVVRVGSANTS